MVDLPTAFFITAAQMENGTIVGQIEQPADADAEYFSAVLPKESPLGAKRAFEKGREIDVCLAMDELRVGHSDSSDDD